jgi:hypothetical protein
MAAIGKIVERQKDCSLSGNRTQRGRELFDKRQCYQYTNKDWYDDKVFNMLFIFETVIVSSVWPCPFASLAYTDHSKIGLQ